MRMTTQNVITKAEVKLIIYLPYSYLRMSIKIQMILLLKTATIKKFRKRKLE